MIFSPTTRLRPPLAAAAVLATAVLTASCSSTSKGDGVQSEAFGSTTTHSRIYDNPPAFTCEAARRALLSQGFLIISADRQSVNGRKNFQPTYESHVEIELYVTCAAEGRRGKQTIAFVNAVQDRYALKKSNNSASVGVGAFGSLSLPLMSSDDSLVKVASETITQAPFYDRFYTLLQRYLAVDVDPADESLPVIEPTAPSAPASAPGQPPPVQAPTAVPARAPESAPAPAPAPAPTFAPAAAPAPAPSILAPIPPLIPPAATAAPKPAADASEPPAAAPMPASAASPAS